jgi:hypothetical protein
MSDVLVLRLPLPASRNQSSDAHWTVRHRNKQTYYDSCSYLLMAKHLPKPPAGGPFKKARISAVAHVWNENDLDNLMARCKWALDWLKREGYIVDDRPKHLKWEGLPEQVVDRSGRALTLTLTITREAA